MSGDVRFAVDGAVGRITLDRANVFHALNTQMCEEISRTLLAWREDTSVQAVILDHASETRGFCAGGDVVSVRRSAQEDGGKAGRDFFRAEYRMNNLLFTYPKPTVAFMDGVTMGGGVGLALPCKYRVATERTIFAMPEGAIGLFPDVGAVWHLQRLPGQIGKFLALTGARLDGAECKWAGLATHYMASDQIGTAKARIMGEPDRIDFMLGLVAVKSPPARLEENAWRINALFSSDNLEGVIAALAADGSEWSNKELRAVTSKCPTTSKVTLRQFAEVTKLPDFAANMALEYRIAARMMMREDFSEGVRAVLVDKDNEPQWDPPEPRLVSDEMLDAIFAPLPAGHEWTPLN